MRALYIIPAMFPYGWAYAARARNLAKIVDDYGDEMTVMCNYLSDGMIWKDSNIAYDGNIKIVTTTGIYASERTIKDKLLVRKLLKSSLEEYLSNNQVDYIICSQTQSVFCDIFKVAQKRGIPLILEICEWYSYKNWNLGLFDPRYWQFKYVWRFQLPRVKKVICISRLLEEHYSQLGAETIKIPTILDVVNRKYKTTEKMSHPPRLVFVGGITGGKDELATLIMCVCRSQYNFEVYIYGPGEEAIRRLIRDKNIDVKKYTEKIHVIGYIDQREIEDKLIECDFGILIRPNRRSSNAGFPTKLGEYFAAGLPVIANATGDIGLYLKDGYNGFLLANNSEKEINRVLEQISLLTNNKYAEMGQNARMEAEKAFDYRMYAPALQKFIWSVKADG